MKRKQFQSPEKRETMIPLQKVFPLTILAVFLLSACAVPMKLTESGRYDEAIHLAVRKLSGKKKKKAIHVQALETAFAKATQQDMRLAQVLEEEGNPSNWERINQIHRRIQFRQNQIEPFLPLIDEFGYEAKFRFVKIDRLEQESRDKTAEFYYAEAQQKLRDAQSGQKLAARAAYNDLQQVRRYNANYNDIEQLQREALHLGTSRILIQLENQTQQLIPRALEEELLRFGVGDLDSRWKQYSTNPNSNQPYDYSIKIKLLALDVSPDLIQERTYKEEKEVRDGWEYMLDENGNVLKDSLGNDIKEPRFIRVRAQVLEALQRKSASILARVDIFDRRSNDLLFSDKISSDALFEHYASTFRGDRRALSKESVNCIENQPLPFPASEILLLQAADQLKPVIKQLIAVNQYII
jgi:hypothetical protein